ncbi:MAG TPA: penicillin-binding protein 2 [Chloroflexia bacterium]|nr:penicillin-binding protein 2 [Chloroflexia bacterium]
MATDTLRQRAQQASRHRKLDSRRLWVVLIFFTLFAGYNAWKVFSVQVLDYGRLSTMAEGRIKWKDTLVPRRGLIYDSRGQLLAGNTTAEDVYVDKTHTDDEDLHKISDLLAPVIGQQPGDLYTRLKEAPGTNVRVASRLNDADTAKVRDLLKKNPKELELKVSLDMQPMRHYPADKLAAPVLGFTDHENQGHYGVEEFYNARLAGEAGWIIAEHDAYGRPLVLQQPESQPAKDGSDLVLTIDSAIQYMAERELQRSIEEFKADSGYIIVQDPNTGGILAMSNFPTFNPNDFSKVTDYSLFKNTNVNDMVEPGSTMKVLTYASAIDAGAVMSNTTFYGMAYFQRYGWTLWNATHTEWGNQSMTLGLGRSDNVASMFAAEKLGERKFFEYIKSFGIGKRTGIDLSGEVASLITYPEDEGYSPINLYTNSFGQGVATTPIQLINAVSAVANGGRLLKPHVMKEIRQGDKVIEQFETTEIRRVLKPETARDIADMLAYGVENKLVARFSQVPGYHVSVKTGTAQLPDGKGGYLADGSLASAMGFAPSHDAQFTLYIGFFNPRTSQWGENTASVSWGRLAKELLLYMNAQPSEPLPTPTP